MKKKILSVSLVAIILVIAITGASLAYLTNKQEQVNTFTSGNVKITLDESKVELDADGYVSATLTERTSAAQDYGKMYPGQEITKDPKITNVGSEKAYIAAKVTVTATDLEALIGSGYEHLLRIDEILSGGLVNASDTQKPSHPLAGTLPVYGDATYSIYQVMEAPGVHVFYIFIEDIMAPGASVTLFEKFTVPARWTNEDVLKVKDLNVTVTAYATQVQTFDDCLDAMVTAFPTDFPFVLP